MNLIGQPLKGVIYSRTGPTSAQVLFIKREVVRVIFLNYTNVISTINLAPKANRKEFKGLNGSIYTIMNTR